MKGLLVLGVLFLILLATSMEAVGRRAATRHRQGSESSSLALAESCSSDELPSSRAQMKADRKAVHVFNENMRTILRKHRRRLLDHYDDFAAILYEQLVVRRGERSQNWLISKWSEGMERLLKNELADAAADMLEAVESRWKRVGEEAVKLRRSPFNKLEGKDEAEQKPPRLDLWRDRLGQQTAGKGKTSPFAHLV